MSSYYDDASLVVIPSGYKTSKVYAEKPTNGSGDLAFTRTGDTATRVNSAGLIEKVRTNLIVQSQNLTTAAWSLVGSATRTANYGIAPDGTQTSTRIQWDGVTAFELYQYTGVSAPVYGSIYIKGTAGQTIYFNGASVTLTGDWQRYGRALVVDGSNTYMTIQGYVLGGTNALDFQLWGAQAETGDVATAYIPTTTAAVTVGPVANVPRLDYLGSTCPRLLLEPQRTNELQFSEQANNAYWTLFGATISANTTATLDPAGYYGADKLQEDTSTSAHTYGVSISGGSATKTLSVFAKAAERNWAALRLYNGSASFFAYFNLSTGALGSVTAGATSAITSYGNGWYRCSITLALGAGTCEPNIYASTGNGTINYQGVTGSGIYVWGAQLEAGACATSYIPTLGAAVTRGADSCSKTGISSLIGQTEGTLYADVDLELNGLSTGILAIFGIGTTFVYIYVTGSTNVLNTNVYINGNAQALLTYTLPSPGRYKIAAGYKANDFVLYVNGVQRASDDNGSVPVCSTLIIDEVPTYSIYPNSKHREALLFKTRLTNAQLAELTTL